MTSRRERDAVASAALRSQGTVSSPCNLVCTLDADGIYCIGCFRTLEEIAGWSAFDEERRRSIWSELERRRARASGALE